MTSFGRCGRLREAVCVGVIVAPFGRETVIGFGHGFLSECGVA